MKRLLVLLVLGFLLQICSFAQTPLPPTMGKSHKSDQNTKLPKTSPATPGPSTEYKTILPGIALQKKCRMLMPDEILTDPDRACKRKLVIGPKSGAFVVSGTSKREQHPVFKNHERRSYGFQITIPLGKRRNQ